MKKYERLKRYLPNLKKQVDIELFKRGNFKRVTKGKHPKQDKALQILTDKTTQQLLYGGAAGGAKTWTGCVWLIYQCLIYPQTRWCVGREELKRITQSTLITFLKCFTAYGITQKDYKYNGQMNFIEFSNGSRIDFLELKRRPADPLYERFGSLEYTGVWIEEGGESNRDAYEILNTRVGRHKNIEYNLLPKMLITSNPKQGYLYDIFYKPYKENTLPDKYKVVEALVTDNPFISPTYIESLKEIKDDVRRERLLHGNWEYINNPYSLCDYDAINDLYSNDHVKNGFKYITGDVARYGSDLTVIGVWSGWRLIEIVTADTSSVTDTAEMIKKLMRKHRVGASRVVVDEDGVGGGVVDILKIKGFLNNSKPIKQNRKMPNYRNLQTQCLYILSEVINKREMYIEYKTSAEVKEMITADLSSIATDGDIDNVLSIAKKKDVKKILGRSPDYRDMIMMRVIFDIKKTRQFMANA